MNTETVSAGRPMRGATAVLDEILQSLEDAGAEHAAAATPASSAAAGEDDAQTKTQSGPRAKIGDIIDRLDERAFGFLLLFLALPCCLPFVYILPQIVALPMLALAAQLAIGRKHPWLPSVLHEREFSVPAFRHVTARAEKYVGWVERFARPRLQPITSHVGAQITGLLLLIPTASILVPLPSTNTIPGIGVAIASLGIIERDGVLVVLGLLIGFAWVALLLVLGFEASQIIKDWLSTRL